MTLSEQTVSSFIATCDQLNLVKQTNYLTQKRNPQQETGFFENV